jgi:hypothetical protein
MKFVLKDRVLDAAIDELNYSSMVFSDKLFSKHHVFKLNANRNLSLRIVKRWLSLFEIRSPI